MTAKSFSVKVLRMTLPIDVGPWREGEDVSFVWDGYSWGASRYGYDLKLWRYTCYPQTWKATLSTGARWPEETWQADYRVDLFKG